jgi:hypothetical protein
LSSSETVRSTSRGTLFFFAIGAFIRPSVTGDLARASRHSDTSLRVDGTSGNLAVCVLHDSVARFACGSISGGSGRRSANALRTGAKCSSNGHQRRVNARDWNAVHSASCEPDVARCDVSNPIAILGRPSTAGTVQHRRHHFTLRGDSYRGALLATDV